MTPYLLILILILAALAAPAAVGSKPWLRFALAVLMSFLVVALPLFVFFFSSFMVPEWKGACVCGWVDCFIVGKLAFTPFVLMATAALYSLEVLRKDISTNRWAVAGIFLGAIIATSCLVLGLMCIQWVVWMFVPLYVAIWYVVRAAQLMWSVKTGFWTYFSAALCTIPSWLLGWSWSRQVYDSLPNQAPTGCFIVTAASRGHERCVGPLTGILRNGRRQLANQQLISFWQFEDLWQSRSPRCHGLFRRIYNHVGPVIATRVRSPWIADAIYLALKPAELAVRCINQNHKEYCHELRQMD